MDTVIRNPGLHHLVEKVFWNLDVENLKICAQINQSCKQILQIPIKPNKIMRFLIISLEIRHYIMTKTS